MDKHKLGRFHIPSREGLRLGGQNLEPGHAIVAAKGPAVVTTVRGIGARDVGARDEIRPTRCCSCVPPVSVDTPDFGLLEQTY